MIKQLEGQVSIFDQDGQFGKMSRAHSRQTVARTSKRVLQAIAEIADHDVFIPRPEKWNKPGCIVGRGWSIAWRILDAQYRGVPQRRRRIYLVADFADERAGEILFEREGVRGYFETGRTPWEGTAADAEGGAGADDREGGSNCVTTWDVQSRRLYTPDGSWPSLYGGEGGGHGKTVNTITGDHNNRITDYSTVVCVPTDYSFDSLASNSMKSANPHSGCRATEVAKTLDTTDQNPCKNQGGIAIVQHVPNLLLDDQGGQRINVSTDGTWQTLRAEAHRNLPCVVETQLVYCLQAFGLYKESEVASSMKQRDYKDATDLVCGVDCRNLTEHPELYPTLQAHSSGGYSINFSGAIRVQYIVRRLTPTECARLQGFPDWWDADVEGSDSARYKMWGNGIALPCAEIVLRRIAEFVRIERMG